jgi:hypothetical protein
MQKYKQRLKEQWPLLVFGLALSVAPLVEQFVGVPTWISSWVVGSAYVGWFILHAVRVWRQAAQDKRDLEAKQAAADAQLFGRQVDPKMF